MNIFPPAGKFLKILHRFNDALWNFGKKKLPTPIVTGTEPITATTGIEKIEDLTIKEDGGVNDNNNEILDKNNEENLIKIEEESKEINSDNKINIVKEEGNQVVEEKEILIEISPEEMDKNIEIVFLTALKMIIQPQEDMFPLDPGTLLRDYLRPLAQEMNIPFDFKLSSHKKINNYLKHLSKDLNMITFGKPKGMQNDFILRVAWEHPQYIPYLFISITEFKPRPKKIKFILKKDDEEDDRDNVILQEGEKIEVLQMFKPNQNARVIFEKMHKDPTQFYQIKECNDVLTSYIKANELFLKGSGEVKINDALYSTCIYIYIIQYLGNQRIRPSQ